MKTGTPSSSAILRVRSSERESITASSSMSGKRSTRRERISRSLTAGGAEDDRVVLGELLSDHARGIARPRDETLDALVVRALPEKLVQGRALPTATLLRDMEQRDRAVVRLRELDAES